MTPKELITELDKLGERAIHAWTADHAIIWDECSTAEQEFFTTLLEAYPTLRKAALAGEALREAVHHAIMVEDGKWTSEVEDLIEDALAAYDKAME